MITRLAAVVLAAAAVLAALFACTPASPSCDPPFTLCSATVCANLDNDAQHCGTCGGSCSSGQTCVSGKCACPAGTFPCNGICVDVTSDSKNCGGCGISCQGQMCIDKQCGCPAGGCVCPKGQSLINGACSATVFATCFNSGELVALDDDLNPLPSSTLVGQGPQSIGVYGGRVLVADGLDNALYRFDPQEIPVLKETGSDKLDKQANQVVIHGDRAYVVATGDNLVQVIDLSKTAPVSAASVERVIDEIPTSPNASPGFATFVGDRLYLSLTGNCLDPTAGDTAGNRVLEIDVSGAKGKVTRELAFSAADYDKDISAAANSPRPAGLAAVGTKLFVAIGNLDPGCLGAAGPGYLAVVDTSAAPLVSHALRLPDQCRNPTYLVAGTDRVYVACSGAYGFGADVEESLVVVKASDESLVTTTTFARCADPSAKGPNACKTVVPGRLALHGSQLLITDSNSGRLLVTDLDGHVPDVFLSGVQVCPLRCPGGDTSAQCYQLTSDVAVIR